MKKIPLFLIVALFAAQTVFASDYEDGYRKGYADAKAGLRNAYANSSQGSKNLSGRSGAVSDKNIWTVQYFVDKHGDATNNGFVRNKAFATGVYNTASKTNEKLLWYLIITDKEISFVLCEGDENSRVKGSLSHPKRYRVSVRDKKENTMTFTGSNSRDRLTLENDSAFRDILSAGEPVNITITRDIDPLNVYSLGEFDPTGFDEVYSILYK